MQKNDVYFKERLGPQKYQETLDTLAKVVVQEEKRGAFLAIEGDID